MEKSFLVVCLIIGVVCGSANGVPLDDTINPFTVDNNTYWISNQEESYFSAKRHCESTGGSLAVPENDDELASLVKNAISNGLTNSENVCLGVRVLLTRSFPFSNERKVFYKTDKGDTFNSIQLTVNQNISMIDFESFLDTKRTWCLTANISSGLYIQSCSTKCSFICERLENTVPNDNIDDLINSPLFIVLLVIQCLIFVGSLIYLIYALNTGQISGGNAFCYFLLILCFGFFGTFCLICFIKSEKQNNMNQPQEIRFSSLAK